MLQETEKLLDKLSEKFAGGRKEVIVGGRKRKPLNHRRFIESLAEGATLAVAVKDSGSLAKSTLSRQVVGSKILEAHPEYREAITDMIEVKKRQVLQAMTKEKIEGASLSAQAMTFGILTDKGELLAGRPTERVEHDENLEKLEKQQLMAFIFGRLTAGQKRLKEK